MGLAVAPSFALQQLIPSKAPAAVYTTVCLIRPGVRGREPSPRDVSHRVHEHAVPPMLVRLAQHMHHVVLHQLQGVRYALRLVVVLRHYHGRQWDLWLRLALALGVRLRVCVCVCGWMFRKHGLAFNLDWALALSVSVGGA